MNEIELLLEKYWEGETTLAEERQLKDFFVKNTVLPPHLVVFREQFVFFSETKKEGLNEDFDKKIIEKLPKNTKQISFLTQANRSAGWWVSGVAAGIALLVIGFLIGKTTSQPVSQITALENEMKSLKETVMLSQLKQTSASERLKGVNYVSEVKSESPEVLEALIETLNTDESSNVRLAAANVLFTLREIPKVRKALVASLRQQEDPAVKIAIINMMIALKEKQAKPAIEEFLRKEPIPKEVKESIRKELQHI
ncbi:MAG: HEAT repeat domain-containing protein [Verrucomicrobia bacterium]|nr:HEAT repeat domain-containing protein [Cytophagales bacterium]